jgi:carbamate kinase
MGPKVESAVHFLRAGGREVVITSNELLCEAVAGRAGTHVVPDAKVVTSTMAVQLNVPVGGR